MKSLFIATIALACVSMIGCAHNTAPVNSATNNTDTTPLPDKCEHRPCPDTFDKAGDVFAASTRYVYDAGSNSWKWMSSPEMQLRYHEAWEATKKAAGKAYDAAKDTYDSHK